MAYGILGASGRRAAPRARMARAHVIARVTDRTMEVMIARDRPWKRRTALNAGVPVSELNCSAIN